MLPFSKTEYRGSILRNYKTGRLALLESISILTGFLKALFIGAEIHKQPTPVLFLQGENDAFQSPAQGKKVIPPKP